MKVVTTFILFVSILLRKTLSVAQESTKASEFKAPNAKTPKEIVEQWKQEDKELWDELQLDDVLDDAEGDAGAQEPPSLWDVVQGSVPSVSAVRKTELDGGERSARERAPRGSQSELSFESEALCEVP